MVIGSVLMWCGVIVAPPVEVAPPPRPVGPPIAIEAIDGGYVILLNRRTAERLRDALNDVDEKQLAATIRDFAKGKKEGPDADLESALKLELLAFLVSTQLPSFEKALAANIGPGGTTIRVTGLQAPTVKIPGNRPALQKVIGVVRGVMPLMGDETRGAVEALRAVGRTTPLSWKVEPRP